MHYIKRIPSMTTNLRLSLFFLLLPVFIQGKVISSVDHFVGKTSVVEPEWKKVKAIDGRFLTARFIHQKDQVLGDRDFPELIIISRTRSNLNKIFVKAKSSKHILQRKERDSKNLKSESVFKEILPGHSNSGSFLRTRVLQHCLPNNLRHSVDASHLPDALLLYPTRKYSQRSKIAFDPVLPILRSSRSSVLPFGTSKTDNNV